MPFAVNIMLIVVVNDSYPLTSDAVSVEFAFSSKTSSPSSLESPLPSPVESVPSPPTESPLLLSSVESVPSPPTESPLLLSSVESTLSISSPLRTSYACPIELSSLIKIPLSSAETAVIDRNIKVKNIKNNTFFILTSI